MTSVTNRRRWGLGIVFSFVLMAGCGIVWYLDPLNGVWVAVCNGTTHHLFLSRTGKVIRGFGFGSGRVLMTGESTRSAFAAISYSGRDTLIAYGYRPFFGKLHVTLSDGKNITECSYERASKHFATIR
jgi:hypothetical protein